MFILAIWHLNFLWTCGLFSQKETFFMPLRCSCIHICSGSLVVLCMWSILLLPFSLQKLKQKNQQLKQIMDQLRNLIWEINSMLAVRSWEAAAEGAVSGRVTDATDCLRTHFTKDVGTPPQRRKTKRKGWREGAANCSVHLVDLHFNQRFDWNNMKSLYIVLYLFIGTNSIEGFCL